MRGLRRLAAPGALVALAVAGCASEPAPTPQEAAVHAAAAESAAVDGTVERVDCWDLESHIIDPADSETLFRVICRVHYDQQGTDRYKDMWCIGDLAAEPVLDHCYPWLPYDGVPTFEEG